MQRGKRPFARLGFGYRGAAVVFPRVLFRMSATVVLTLCLCIMLQGGSFASQSDPGWQANNPRIVQGVLDLSSWDFSTDTLALDGEWEFYWNQLIDPHAFNHPEFSTTPSYISVPGSWKGLNVDGTVLPGEGYGTYRVQIVLPKNSGPVGLYLPNVMSSYELWVNGRRLEAQGIVAEHAALATPQSEDVIVGLGPGSSHVDVVLHVANFAFREGGIAASIILGRESLIVTELQRSLSIDMFLIASLLVIGIYQVGLWTLRPNDRHALFFGLFCIAIALRTSVMDQAPVRLMMPGFPWEVALKIEYLGFYVGLLLFILFLQSLFPKEMRRHVVIPLITVCGLFSLLVLVTPARIHSHALAYFEIVAVIAFIYMTYALLRAARRGRYGAKVILIGAGIVFLVVIQDMLFFWQIWGFRALTPAAILCMVLAYSFVLSKNFADEFERQRVLTEENTALLSTVQRQVEQITASRRLMNEREERTRRDVAEMLHGTVQSRLLSAYHYLQAALQQLASTARPNEDNAIVEAQKAIQKAQDQIEHASSKDVRTISHLLHPMLIRMGLLPAIQSLVERFSEHMTVEIRVGDGFTHFQDRLGTDGVDRPVRLAVYRIVEEALSNVVKHAEASRVEIYLDVLDENVGEVIVKDNGRGMRDATRTLGLGLQMMVARAEELHGTVNIESAPGIGTTIHIRVPFRAQLPKDGANDRTRVKNSESAAAPSGDWWKEIAAGTAETGDNT